MKYEGNVIIQYANGVSRILNIEDAADFPAGHLMCQLSQDDAIHMLITRAKVVQAYSLSKDEPVTPESVDEGERAIINYLLDFADEQPVEAHLSAGIMHSAIERHRTLIGREENSVIDYIIKRIQRILSEEIADYICDNLSENDTYEARFEKLLFKLPTLKV